MVRIRLWKVASSRCGASRLSSSLQRSRTGVDDGRGRHSVLGRPRPLKLVMSTLIWLESMIQVIEIIETGQKWEVVMVLVRDLWWIKCVGR